MKREYHSYINLIRISRKNSCELLRNMTKLYTCIYNIKHILQIYKNKNIQNQNNSNSSVLLKIRQRNCKHFRKKILGRRKIETQIHPLITKSISNNN